MVRINVIETSRPGMQGPPALAPGDVITNEGDIIVGGALGVPERMAAGPLGSMLGIGPLGRLAFAGRHVVYLDWFSPIADGSTDDATAFQTAYDALPNPSGTQRGGGTILVSPGAYALSHLDMVQSKPVVVRAMQPRTVRRTNATFNKAFGDVTITTLDTGSGSYCFSTHNTGDVNHTYGFQFIGIDFDMHAGTEAAIYAVDSSFVVVEDCGALQADASKTGDQWLIRAHTEASGDNSWWRVANNVVNRVGLCDVGMAGRVQNNQWAIRENVGFSGSGAAQQSAMVRLRGGANRWATWANNFEMVSSANPAFDLEGLTGSMLIADAGEFSGTPPSTFLKARGCSGNLWMPIGNSSSGDNEYLIDDDGANLLLSPAGMNNYAGDEKDHLLRTDAARMFGGITGNGLQATRLAPVPMGITRDVVDPILPDESAFDLAVPGNVSLEYWDGAAWTTWAPTNAMAMFANVQVGPNMVVGENPVRITVGTTDSFPANEVPLVLLQFSRGSGSPTGDVTVTVEALHSGATVQYTNSFTVDLSINTTGVSYPMPRVLTGASGTVRITIDAPLTGSEALRIDRVQVLSRGGIRQNGLGNHYRCYGDPNGLVVGRPGDLCTRLNGGAGTTLYVKESGYTTDTGWVAK